MVVVWGPAGAPGRTLVATALAATLAERGLRTTLVDADPYAASVAQQLGVLDEVSGLLSAARLTGDGALASGFASVQRALGDHLTVVTGLPRPDRWVEVRAGVLEHLLEVARTHGQVVVDTGFSLEDDPASDLMTRPGRNQLTLGALDVADEVVVVGSADPVGLARLARGLVELRERRVGAPIRVVVNRMRPTLGWSERDIVGMVEGFSRLAAVHFLPDDRATADRALVSGTSVADSRRHRARPRRCGGGRGPGPLAVTAPRAAVSAQDEKSRYRPPMVKMIIASSSGSWPVTWCFFGRILMARSWAAMTPST